MRILKGMENQGKERKSEATKREVRGSCLKRWDEWIDAEGGELKKEWGNHLPIRVDPVRNRIEVHVPIGKIPGARL